MQKLYIFFACTCMPHATTSTACATPPLHDVRTIANECLVLHITNFLHCLNSEYYVTSSLEENKNVFEPGQGYWKAFPDRHTIKNQRRTFYISCPNVLHWYVRSHSILAEIRTMHNLEGRANAPFSFTAQAELRTVKLVCPFRRPACHKSAWNHFMSCNGSKLINRKNQWMVKSLRNSNAGSPLSGACKC